MTRRAWRTGGLLAVSAAMALGSVGCGDDDGGDTAAFCEEYRSFEQEGEDLFAGILSTAEGGGIDELKQAFDDATEQFQQLAEEAPDEISDDVETVVDVFVQANEQIQEAESQEDLESLDQGGLDSEEADQAADRLDEWTQDNCDSGSDAEE